MKIPQGHQAVMPYLIVNGAASFLEFMTRVFPVEVTHTSRNGDGTLGHCEVRIHGCTLMFSNSTGLWPPRTADLFIYVENADACFNEALNAGATSVMPVENKHYGRSGGVQDPFGNIWWITSVAE